MNTIRSQKAIPSNAKHFIPSAGAASCTLLPKYQQIMVALIEYEFTAKRLDLNDSLKLRPEHPTYPLYIPTDNDQVSIWGARSDRTRWMVITYTRSAAMHIWPSWPKSAAILEKPSSCSSIHSESAKQIWNPIIHASAIY
ncbi:MAG: hypothetical protein AAF385_04865 [Pseudomonadota bacterium]